MNMIERVARAICRKRGFNPEELTQVHAIKYWCLFIPDARAVFEVMRDPTDAMIEAERIGSVGKCFPSDGTQQEMNAWAVTNSWQAMIDQALKDKPEEVGG